MFTQILRRLTGQPVHSQAQSGISLGRNLRDNQSLVLTDAQLCGHVAVSGAQGSGVYGVPKSVLLQQTALGRGWVCLETRFNSELRDQLAEAAHAAGRSDEFYVLDMTKPADSHRYNFMRNGSPTELAFRTLQLLPANDGNPAVAHYARTGRVVLEAVYAALAAIGSSVSIPGLVSLIQREDLLRLLQAQVPVSHPAHSQLANVLQAYTKVTPGSRGHAVFDSTALLQNLEELVIRLRQLHADWPGLLDAAAPNIDFHDILMHNKMCYIALPMLFEQECALGLGRMLLTDLHEALVSRQALPTRLSKPFLLALPTLDFYATQVPGLAYPWGPEAFTLASQQNVGVFSVFQSWHPAKVAAPDLMAMVLHNTDTQVSFRQAEVASGASTEVKRLAEIMSGSFVLKRGVMLLTGRQELGDPATVSRTPHALHPMSALAGRPRWPLVEA